MMALATVTAALWLKLRVAFVPMVMVLLPNAADTSLPSPTFKVPPLMAVAPV